jgi:hypothetical protein
MKALLAAAVLAGCASTSDESVVEAGGEEAQELVVEGVDWVLSWDLEGTERVEEGRQLTTDQGYVVTLTSGVAVSFAVTLDPCEEVTVTWLDAVGIGTAHAHHGEFADPSLLELQIGEDLIDPLTSTFATRFEEARYCGVHWSIARPDPRRQGWAGNPKARSSLVLRGGWVRGDESGVFAWETEWPDGQGREFGVDVSIPATSDGPIQVELERDLAGLLDGIDLAVATDNQATWAVLENLVGGYRASIRPRS